MINFNPGDCSFIDYYVYLLQESIRFEQAQQSLSDQLKAKEQEAPHQLIGESLLLPCPLSPLSPPLPLSPPPPLPASS